MDARQLRPSLALAGWTLLVWTTRIRNIWTDEELSVGGQVGRTALAVAFTAFAVVTIALWVRARRGAPHRMAPAVVRAFAVWTVAVWVVRGVQIATADHDGAFVAVHTALASVSVGLAVWADRSTHTASPTDQGTLVGASRPDAPPGVSAGRPDRPRHRP
jgi:hypothetical protein